jgi:mycoredoxin
VILEVSMTNSRPSAPIQIYATAWCPDCALAKRVLDDFHAPYAWIDITGNDEAIAYVTSVNGGNRSVPTIVLPDGRTMTEPSSRELSAELVALGYMPSARSN